MDTGYPAFTPEPYTHPTKPLKPSKSGKSCSNSKGDRREDEQCDDEERKTL